MDMFSMIFNRLYLEDYKLESDAYRPREEEQFSGLDYARADLKRGTFPRQKGEKSMAFVKLTCRECGVVFLLEAKDPKEGAVAKETPLCRHLNLMRQGEAFEHHKHSNFKWEASR